MNIINFLLVSMYSFISFSIVKNDSELLVFLGSYSICGVINFMSGLDVIVVIVFPDFLIPIGVLFIHPCAVLIRF